MTKRLLSLLLVFLLVFEPLTSTHAFPQDPQPPARKQPEEKKEEKKKPGLLDRILSAPDKINEKIDRTNKKIEQTMRDPFNRDRRAWTDQQKAAAGKAQLMFAWPMRTQLGPRTTITDETIFNPADPVRARQMLRHVQELRNRYKNQRQLTPEQSAEVVGALLPFWQYVDATGATTYLAEDPQTLRPHLTPSGAVHIPPNREVRLQLRTVCLDFGTSTPHAGEKNHLVPANKLSGDLDEDYRRLVAYSQGHPEAYGQVQRVAWYIRHGCANEKAALLQLRSEDYSLLESISPGATQRMKDHCRKVNWKQVGLDMVSASLNGGGQLTVNPAGIVDANQKIVEVAAAHRNIPVDEPIPNDNSDYSLLTDGVGVQARHSINGVESTQVTIRNTTSQPVLFNPQDWVLESRRQTQRLGLVGVDAINGSKPDDDILDSITREILDALNNLDPQQLAIFLAICAATELTGGMALAALPELAAYLPAATLARFAAIGARLEGLSAPVINRIIQRFPFLERFLPRAGGTLGENAGKAEGAAPRGGTGGKTGEGSLDGASRGGKGQGSPVAPTGNVPKILDGQQGKHIPGHKNFRPGRSELTADPNRLAQRAGTGQPANNVPRGQPGFKERVDFGENIGNFVDEKTGQKIPTTKGTIHYAKDGIHIVPARP